MNDVREVVARARQFVRAEILPHEKLWLTCSFRDLEPVFGVVRERAKSLGLWAPSSPTAVGGLGLGHAAFAEVSEELGYTPFGHYLAGCNAPDAGNIELLSEFGTEEQKARFLVPLVQGRTRSCFAMTEKNTAGSNPLAMMTSARKEGDSYLIDGEKWFSTGADGAAFAIVMANTSSEGPEHARASMFLIPMETAGLSLIRNISVMGHVGDGLFSHSELEFRGVRVPSSHRLGPENQGFVLAQKRLGAGRIHHCSRWLGVARRALDLLCERANAREVARGEKLAEKQIIQTWVAECAAEIAASRALVREVARLIDDKGTKEAQLGIGMIKFHVAGVLQKVLDRSVQAHGALGLTDDLVLSLLYRQERAARIYDGPDEVHKLSVGSKWLKAYRERGD